MAENAGAKDADARDANDARDAEAPLRDPGDDTTKSSARKANSRLFVPLLCLYGLLKEIRPATPFLTPFLITEKNLTQSEVYSEVYPIWTYSFLAFLAPVFLLTDLVRYRPVVVAEALSLTGTWALLVWGSGVRAMQLMQVCFGLSSACEVAYFACVYAWVSRERYRSVTSLLKAVVWIGKLIAFGGAQILISTDVSNYLFLNQVTFGFLLAALGVALSLSCFRLSMSASRSDEIMPSRCEDGDETRQKSPSPPSATTFNGDAIDVVALGGFAEYLRATAVGLRGYVSDRPLLLWSVWWALTTCGMYQVYNYEQVLWSELQTDRNHVLNGAVECANQLAGTVVTIAAAHFKMDWRGPKGAVFLAFSALLLAVLIGVQSSTTSIWASYALYCIMTASYNFLDTGGSANIALRIKGGRFALVRGVNLLTALLLQTALTFAVSDSRGFNLPIRAQFMVYGAYFAAIAVLFSLAAAAFRLFGKKLNNCEGNA